MIQHGEGELGELAMEELSVCCEEIERLKASLMNAVIPQDEADRHSAVLELRPGRQNNMHTEVLLFDIASCVGM